MNPRIQKGLTMAYFAPMIDAAGIHMPTYEDRLQDLLSAYCSIFGQEAELSPETPDYQLLSVFAKALDDTSALVLSAYNSRNPAYASGQALDLLLPQYGITRQAGETDAEARNRMNLAAAARGIFSTDALEAAIREIPGVTHVLIRVNDGDGEEDGIPGHTIAAYANNGDADRIADAIWRKKPPGIGTYGTTVRTVTDGRGNPHTVRFSRPVPAAIAFRITLRAYEGFDAEAVPAAMKSALMTLVNRTLEIGEAINVPQLYGMLYQAAGSYASTFAITDLCVTGAHGVEREKLVPAWNVKFTMPALSDVAVTVQ